MRLFVGIILGFFSAFLIYMLSAMVFVTGEPSSVFVLVTFVGGWILSSWLFVKGTHSVSRVFSRGFLIGSAEWLALIPVGMIFSGRAASEAMQSGGGTDAEIAGAALGAGVTSFVTGGVAVVMALVCLVGFAISYFIGREMKPETAAPTKVCPECAELIQENARRCKHCGSEIASPEGQSSA